jgi:molybdopterin-guanine dinucleotide biosynthesis protein A
MPRMKADTGRAGIVLAGGPSTRFEDGDKALAALAGRPLLLHAVEAVSPVVDDVVVSCRRDQRRSFESALEGVDVSFATDPIDGLGPVGGLRTALRETDRLTAVVIGCDSPLVPPAFLGHLLDRLEGSTTAGVLVRTDGRTRRLPTAVNTRAAAAAASEALDDGGTLHDVVESLAPVVIPEHHVAAAVDTERLVTVDTRADLARVEETLGRRIASGSPDGSPSGADGVRSNGR